MDHPQISQIDAILCKPHVTATHTTDPGDAPLGATLFLDLDVGPSTPGPFALLRNGQVWFAHAEMQGDALVLSGPDRPDEVITGGDLMRITILGAVKDVGVDHLRRKDGTSLFTLRTAMGLDRVEAADLLDTTPRTICDLEEGPPQDPEVLAVLLSRLQRTRQAQQDTLIAEKIAQARATQAASGKPAVPFKVTWLTDDLATDHPDLVPIPEDGGPVPERVPRALMAALGLEPAWTRIADVPDNRMAPLYQKGRDVLIDTRHTHLMARIDDKAQP